MKTNISTNRFETVLPDSLRRRYRVPHGTILKKAPPRVAPPPPRERTTSPWLIAGGIAVFIGLAATAHILAGFADKADTMPYAHEAVPTPTPAPVMAPVATPAPISVATPEVRRAEPVPTPTFRSAHMPDGSSMAVRILGAFTRQEELPLTGNVVGDVYYVGRFPFVWTQLNNGTGAWIDPQIK